MKYTPKITSNLLSMGASWKEQKYTDRWETDFDDEEIWPGLPSPPG